jgi:putative flippase GtrA
MRRSPWSPLPRRGVPAGYGLNICRRYLRGGRKLFCGLPEIVQFLITGGVVALVGILLMRLLEKGGIPQRPAFYTQLGVTLQMNLAANSIFTWNGRSGRTWPERIGTWIRYHVSRGPGILLNSWAFPLAAAHVSVDLAYWGSLTVGTALNFALAKFWVFRRLPRSRKGVPAV